MSWSLQPISAAGRLGHLTQLRARSAEFSRLASAATDYVVAAELRHLANIYAMRASKLQGEIMVADVAAQQDN
jgi:hypothetical protein